MRLFIRVFPRIDDIAMNLGLDFLVWLRKIRFLAIKFAERVLRVIKSNLAPPGTQLIFGRMSGKTPASGSSNLFAASIGFFNV